MDALTGTSGTVACRSTITLANSSAPLRTAMNAANLDIHAQTVRRPLQSDAGVSPCWRSLLIVITVIVLRADHDRRIHHDDRQRRHRAPQ